MNNSLKHKIYNECIRLLEARISDYRIAMNAAQEAANSDDKSSAGDKYETARAMGQLDRDMNAKQLFEAQSELQSIIKIDLDYISESAQIGSLIETSNGIYFIAVGIGVLEIEKQKIIVLSPKSPLAKEMMSKKIGNQFLFNSKEFTVKNIS
ncbi:MAG: hypothetical protein WCO54_01500 [Bacteroidota bacterium]